MATVVISLWARLTTRVRSLAVAKGTGGCKESGGGGPWERRGVGGSFWPGDAASWWVAGVGVRTGVAQGLGLCSAPCLPPFAAAEWTRPVGREAGHSGTRPAPPARPRPRSRGPSPDAPPSAPRSPRAPGCCLRVAAATQGAGCRRRCCRWT